VYTMSTLQGAKRPRMPDQADEAAEALVSVGGNEPAAKKLAVESVVDPSMSARIMQQVDTSPMRTATVQELAALGANVAPGAFAQQPVPTAAVSLQQPGVEIDPNTGQPLAQLSEAMSSGSQEDKMQRKPRKPSVGGKWTAEEDKRLLEIVETHGAKKWKKIAEHLGTVRTDIQCLHRWTKVIKPGLNKGPWTPEEDQIVREHVLRMQSGVNPDGIVKWSSIASQLPGRLGKQCRERWFNHLDPSIKKCDWDDNECRILYNAQVGPVRRDAAPLTAPTREEHNAAWLGGVWEPVVRNRQAAPRPERKRHQEPVELFRHEAVDAHGQVERPEDHVRRGVEVKGHVAALRGHARQEFHL